MYWSPIRLAVKSIMRVDSEEPLMDGVPAHTGDCGALGAISSRDSEKLVKRSPRLRAGVVALGAQGGHV